MSGISDVRYYIVEFWILTSEYWLIMILTVNGKAYKHKGKATVEALLQSMHIDSGRVAVMVNNDVVGRKKYSSARLVAGDRIEILTFAGGG